MSNECIILAGGLGIRLRSVINDVPKCLAPVNGKPFLSYVIAHLQNQGIKKFIFALGYKNNSFNSFFNSLSKDMEYNLSVESEPLGTGGAIKLACSKAFDENVFIANGDTLFKADLQLLNKFHLDKNADCTLCLKPLNKFDRYGSVEIDTDHSIINFREKKFIAEGFINGGLYALNKNKFLSEDLPEKFSFETDYLEKFYTKRKMFGLVQDKYFIDIGIPEDYAKAEKDLLV